MNRRIGLALLVLFAVIGGLLLAVLLPRNSGTSGGPTPVLVATQTIPAARVASTASVRIFDPAGQVALEVRTGDVIKSSARASREFAFDPHRGVLFCRLRPTGAVKFRALTRALAKRGARLGRPQKFALAISGHVVLRVAIDYEATPNGLDGRQGIQVVGLSFAKAQELARAIRG